MDALVSDDEDAMVVISMNDDDWDDEHVDYGLMMISTTSYRSMDEPMRRHSTTIDAADGMDWLRWRVPFCVTFNRPMNVLRDGSRLASP